MSNLVQYPFGESVYLDFVHWDMLWIAFVIDVTVQCWCYGTQKRNKSKIVIVTAMFSFPNHTLKSYTDQSQSAGEGNLLARDIT